MRAKRWGFIALAVIVMPLIAQQTAFAGGGNDQNPTPDVPASSCVYELQVHDGAIRLTNTDTYGIHLRLTAVDPPMEGGIGSEDDPIVEQPEPSFTQVDYSFDPFLTSFTAQVIGEAVLDPNPVLLPSGSLIVNDADTLVICAELSQGSTLQPDVPTPQLTRTSPALERIMKQAYRNIKSMNHAYATQGNPNGSLRRLRQLEIEYEAEITRLHLANTAPQMWEAVYQAYPDLVQSVN